MKMTLTALLTAAGMLMAPAAVIAQDFPSKPVKVVIPFTPGGSNDTLGRYLADGLSKHWDESVIVENRPGAGSTIGSGFVAKSKPDGHTILFVSGTLTTNAATQKNLPFDPINDLEPVGLAAAGKFVIVTGSRVPTPTLGDLVKAAKEQQMFYATTGVGSSTQFVAELFNDVAGIKMEPVHYKGGTDALVDLAGGRVDVYFGTITQVQSTVETGKAHPVAMTSAARSEVFPDVPTVAEAGYPDAAADIWWGVFVPQGTPPEMIASINEGINATMTLPEATEFLAKHGAEPAPMSPEDFKAYVGAELAKWQELAARHQIGAE